MSTEPSDSKTPSDGQSGTDAPSQGAPGVARVKYELANGQVISPASPFFGISPSVGVLEGDPVPASLDDTSTTNLPSNKKTFWNRFKGWITEKRH